MHSFCGPKIYRDWSFWRHRLRQQKSQGLAGAKCASGLLSSCLQDSFPHRFLDGGSQFFTGCYGQRPPFVSCHVDLSNMAACFMKACMQGWVEVGDYVIMGVASHQFWCILFVESKVLGSVYTERKEIMQGMTIKKVRDP